MSPADFEWKDPSKMRIAEACRLLEHWRGHIARGLPSLIWVPTSTLFEDQDDGRHFRQGLEHPQDNSDEELFVLPQSNEIDEDEYESDHSEQCPLKSYHIFTCLKMPWRKSWMLVIHPILMKTYLVSTVSFSLTWSPHIFHV